MGLITASEHSTADSTTQGATKPRAKGRTRHIRWFEKPMWWMNIFLVLVSIGSVFSAYAPPQFLWPFSIIGLGYPYLLVANVAFMLYWLLRRKWHFMLSLLWLLLGFNTFSHSVAFTVPPKNKLANVLVGDAENSLKVLSYNVQNFDLYNWSKDNEARNNILDMITKENPDVICFQEFYSEDNNSAHNVRKIVNELGYPYYFFNRRLSLRGNNHWGLAIFSKYEITDKDEVNIGTKTNSLNGAIYTDLLVNKLPLRVYNVHLQSIHLAKKDYEYVQNVAKGAGGYDDVSTDSKTQQAADKHLRANLSIIRKLKLAFTQRAQQADFLAAHIANSPYPRIVCGDFNDTPASYVYRKIKMHLNDAFLATGLGFGGTYAGPLPSFRIDYMLTDKTIDVHQFEILPYTYTDHYPIQGVVSLPTSAKK